MKIPISLKISISTINAGIINTANIEDANEQLETNNGSFLKLIA